MMAHIGMRCPEFCGDMLEEVPQVLLLPFLTGPGHARNRAGKATKAGRLLCLRDNFVQLYALIALKYRRKMLFVD
jgi:hypothetical protein